MIFYFSGTGNSEWATRTLGKMSSERVVRIADALRDGAFSYTLGENEALGFVFPIYAWAPPPLVLDFIKKLTLSNFNGQYVYAVCTCAEEAGNSAQKLRRALIQKGLRLSAYFSVLMPNNYPIGYDLDTKETVQRKLAEAEETIEDIWMTVQKRQTVFAVQEGRSPYRKTLISNPLFNMFGRSAKPYSVTSACTTCGLCERVCPTGNIHLADGKPVWGNRCALCLACLHRCPARAVEYGKHTVNKGRYVHPILKATEGSKTV